MNNIIKRVWVRNRMVNIDYLGGSAFYAEDGGHTFQISGAESDGSAVALSGTVAGVFLRPDNTDVAITGSASGGVVSVTLPANCYDVPGRFGLTIFLTADDQKTAIYAAVGNVARTSSGAVAPQTTADVVDLINRISAAVATIPQSWTGLMADIAPTYSASAVYPAGAYVYYNGDLYRCTTAITTAETWTPAHWTTANLGTDLRDLKSAFNSFENDNFEFGSFTKNSSIFTAKPQYNASSAGWVSNTGYNSWYFLTDKDTEIYADSTAVSEMYYFSIAVYNGEVSSANYVNRYRLNDNNLPTKSAPLAVGTGKTIVVTIEYRDTDFVLYASNAPLLLGSVFMEQVDKSTDDSIDAFVNKNFAYGYLTKDSAIFTAKPGYSASSAGWVSNTGYNSWYFETDSDCVIYTETNSLSYYSICIYNGSVSSANYVARYRKSENNLPTKEAPLSVQSGQTIVVTIEYADNDFSLFYNLAPVFLGDQMIRQVEDVISRKTKVNYATNQYVITSNGIAFDLRKTTDATINQDCWRFVSVKKNGTDIVNGDIIGVLIENGETDFMGGVHGDEKVVDFHIRADGKPITDAVTVCNKVTIFMYSHLYRVSSPTTNVIDRYVNITIENGVMTVENTFKCLVDGFVVQYAYNGGLIGIFKNNITYLASNSEIADLSNMPSEWNNSHDSYWYDVLFDDGLLHIENIVGKEQQNYSGRVHYFSSETPQRLKVYMTTDTGSTWDTGHICNGKFVYSFE